jgi:hypothetical protein
MTGLWPGALTVSLPKKPCRRGPFQKFVPWHISNTAALWSARVYRIPFLFSSFVPKSSEENCAQSPILAHLLTCFLPCQCQLRLYLLPKIARWTEPIPRLARFLRVFQFVTAQSSRTKWISIPRPTGLPSANLGARLPR